MFSETFLFELYYRRRRATTIVYFIVVFFLTLVTVASPTLRVTGTADDTAANAPYTIALVVVVLSFFCTIITSALVGVAVIRDIEHNMSPLLFTTRVTKGSYLLGRLAGTLVILFGIHAAILLGAYIGFLIGPYSPWSVSWETKTILPFDGWAYFQPFLLFTVTDVFIAGSLFFCIGALVKKHSIIYTQGAALLLLYQIANTMFLQQMEKQRLAAIIDPFAVQTFVYMTRYWNSSAQNTLLVPFSDVMLLNRLLWLAIAAAMIAFTYWKFDFTQRTTTPHPLPNTPSFIHSNNLAPRTQSSTLKQFLLLTRFYLVTTCRDVSFLTIIGAGVVVLIVRSLDITKAFGSHVEPTTQNVLTMIGSFTLFFLIIVVFYSGELIWKERQQKIHAITDATSTPTSMFILSKYCSLLLVYLIFLGVFTLFGTFLQMSNGYRDYHFEAYFGTLYLETFLNLALLTAGAIFVQVLSGNKFVGFVMIIVFILAMRALAAANSDHSLATFGSGTLGVFSDMNGFGSLLAPFLWLKSYWVLFIIILFAPAVAMYRRGTDNNWRAGKRRVSRSVQRVAMASTVLMVITGFHIYFNSADALPKINEERNDTSQSKESFRVVGLSLSIDLFPSERTFIANGTYTIVFHGDQRSDQLVIATPAIEGYTTELDVPGKEIEKSTPESTREFKLSESLVPGDTVKYSFRSRFKPRALETKNPNTEIVYNGTVIGTRYFPAPKYIDPFSKMRLAASLTTDQIGVAPGHLISRTSHEGRNTFAFDTRVAIPYSFALFSANYEQQTIEHRGVKIHAYYDSHHERNIDQILQAARKGMEVLETDIGPYPYDDFSIVEVPNSWPAASSYPTLAAFSESAIYRVKIKQPQQDLDVPFYTTVHEVARQWWNFSVVPSPQPGSGLLKEGPPQFYAMMATRTQTSPSTFKNYLRLELDAYLLGRTGEKGREVPLDKSVDRAYIAYNKSALAFVGLQDRITADSVQAALRRYYRAWSRSDRGPMPSDLLNELRAVAPDTSKYIVSDLFERITLFENKIIEGGYQKVGPNRYLVTIKVAVQKIQIDNDGLVRDVPPLDWIDVIAFTEKSEELEIIYEKKYRFDREKTTIVFETRTPPTRVGIDPFFKLIDRHPSDNTMQIESLVDLNADPL